MPILGDLSGVWDASVPETIRGIINSKIALRLRRILRHLTTITLHSCHRLKGKRKSIIEVGA